MSESQYFPNLPAAFKFCDFLFDSFNIAWKCNAHPNRNQLKCTYREEPTSRLLGTIDQVTVSPQDIKDAGQDLGAYSFLNGYCTAYFFTDFLRKK